jgi:phosphate transport system substrate-binding protein
VKQFRNFEIITGYNIPELAGMELVLDFDTIAAIYLDDITMWDDDRIKALNSPQVVAALPSQPIIVITQSIATGLTSIFTQVLNATVPAFAAQVCSHTTLSPPSFSH